MVGGAVRSGSATDRVAGAVGRLRGRVAVSGFSDLTQGHLTTVWGARCTLTRETAHELDVLRFGSQGPVRGGHLGAGHRHHPRFSDWKAYRELPWISPSPTLPPTMEGCQTMGRFHLCSAAGRAPCRIALPPLEGAYVTPIPRHAFVSLPAPVGKAACSRRLPCAECRPWRCMSHLPAT